MKKNRISFFLTLAIVMIAMLGSCSIEEAIDGGAKKHQLTISVKDGLFTSQAETRTSPTGADGLGTIFTINDKIGIFGVKDGEVIVSNACYTCDGHLWNGENTIEYDSEATYYAYYPWNSDEDLKTVAGVGNVNDAVDPTKTDAAGFFQPLIAKWQPKMDQSKIEDYNASDLMVGKGTAPTGDDANRYTMAFTMDHQMGLCLTTLEEINYVVDANYSFKLMPNYDISGDVKPCYYQGKYRYIVYPGVNRVLSVSNGDEKYSINYFVKKKGNYTEHVVGGSTKEYQPQVGDIYYSDGSMTHGTQISIYKKQVGVVGYVAHNTPDPVLEGYTHGLVICGLQVSGVGSGGLLFTTEARNILNEKGASTIFCNNDIFKNYKGKEITQKMVESKCNLCNGYNYKVSDLLAKINATVPLTQNSTAPNSGWFIPASAQVYKIINALYKENGGNDIGLDETYSTENVRKEVTANGIREKVNGMLERLGSGHYVTSAYWTSLSTLCRYTGSAYIDADFINSFSLQENSLNCTNYVSEYRPIIAF